MWSLLKTQVRIWSIFAFIPASTNLPVTLTFREHVNFTSSITHLLLITRRTTELLPYLQRPCRSWQAPLTFCSSPTGVLFSDTQHKQLDEINTKINKFNIIKNNFFFIKKWQNINISIKIYIIKMENNQQIWTRLNFKSEKTFRILSRCHL